MFNFILKLLRGVSAGRTEIENILVHARTAWRLPKNYMEELEKAPPGVVPSVVYPLTTGKEEWQSPLHRIMDGGHPSLPEELREALWANEEYREIVRHVLHDQGRALIAWAETNATGYTEPMARTILRAAQEGLMPGLKTRKLEESLEGEHPYW